MKTITPCHFAAFSHEFDEGKSGPARSYWSIRYGTPNDNVSMGTLIEMPHRSTRHNIENTLTNLCYIMDKAVERGKNLKVGEFQNLLGMTYEARQKPHNL